MKPQARRILWLMLLCGGLVSLGTGLRLWFPPTRFAAATRVKIQRDVEFERDPSATNAYNAYFMQNEFELIQSDVILGKVVESLALHDRWGRRDGRKLEIPEALGMLKDHLALEPVRCTSLVGIHLTSDDPNEAAEITHAVAEQYDNYRRMHRDSGVSSEVIDAAAIPLKPRLHRTPALCWLAAGTLLTTAGICLGATRPREAK